MKAANKRDYSLRRAILNTHFDMWADAAFAGGDMNILGELKWYYTDCIAYLANNPGKLVRFKWNNKVMKFSSDGDITLID